MRFRTDRGGSSPAGLSRRDQRRIILIIFVLGAVVLAFDLARTPEPSSQLPAREEESVTVAGALRPVVTTESTQGEPSSVADGGALENADANEATTGGDAVGPLGLGQDAWDVFEDNTVGLTRAEGSAYYNALRRLGNLRNSTLGRIARRDVVYSVLMADPEQYRGEAIALRGQLRRLTPAVTHDDGKDLEGVLEGWLFTEDSDIQPYRVVTLDADSSIPRGESFEPVTVELVGVFVKRVAYASNAGTSVAPWLIAKKIHFVPPVVLDTNDRLTPILTAAVCVAMTAIFGAFLMTLRRQTRRRIEFRMAVAERSGPDADIECEPPTEFLAALGAEDVELQMDRSAANRDA